MIHPHTIPQGLIANEFIEAMNQFGANIIPFSDAEILSHAGVPEPAVCVILSAGAGLLLRRKRG